jgi:hypothetical protein
MQIKRICPLMPVMPIDMTYDICHIDGYAKIGQMWQLLGLDVALAIQIGVWWPYSQKRCYKAKITFKLWPLLFQGLYEYAP